MKSLQQSSKDNLRLLKLEQKELYLGMKRFFVKKDKEELLPIVEQIFSEMNKAIEKEDWIFAIRIVGSVLKAFKKSSPLLFPVNEV